jgi:nitrate reductase NapE
MDEASPDASALRAGAEAAAASRRAPAKADAPPHTRKEELRSFLALAVFMAPALAGLIVVGWGFIVWIFQMFAGPPGPHP